MAVKKIKVKMKKTKAEKTLAWEKSGSSYDDVKGEFSFDVNSKTGTDWALIHDGKTAFAIIDGTEKNVTECIHDIEEFKTEQECLNRIKELGLIYITPDNLTEGK